MYYNSRYNFFVPLEGSTVLYNTLSGTLLTLGGDDSKELASLLCRRRLAYPDDSLPDSIFSQLVRGGFLLLDSVEEQEIIRERFAAAKDDTPVVLTITTTMDCNLGCYYCYESRTGHQLETGQVSDIVALARQSLQRKGKRSLHIDWYGGEPLLNLPFLETASLALQKLCGEMEVDYHASVISNGTAWPEDVEGFIRRNKIRQVQISLDGLQENHDKRRRYRKEYLPEKETSSFEQAVHLIDQLLEVVRVDVRLNFDRNNQSDLDGLLKMAESRGWFEKAYPAVIQPARLSAYSETSAFMRSWELSIEEYEALRAKVRQQLPNNVMVEESEVPDGFPYPRTSVCAALAPDSVVVGAEGNLYRCGLQVGEENREVGILETQSTYYALPVIQSGDGGSSEFQDEAFWDTFHPMDLPKCARCSFLPICWGGCPKKHLEKDEHALDEQSKYWRMNLARLIAKKYGKNSTVQYTVADQFRAGWEQFDDQQKLINQQQRTRT